MCNLAYGVRVELTGIFGRRGERSQYHSFKKVDVLLHKIVIIIKERIPHLGDEDQRN